MSAVVSLETKLKYLKSCLNGKHYEDAAGHLCDLLELCRYKIGDNEGRMFANIEYVARYYGKNFHEIKED